MNLEPKEVELYYHLLHNLMVYVNHRHKILKGLDQIDDVKKFSLDELVKVREKLFENPQLIDAFVEKNPPDFNQEELNIVKSWKYFKKGQFIILKCLKNYAIFLDDKNPPKAYAVLGLQSSLKEMFGHALPLMVQAILLPYKDQIIYDGLLMPYNISFGSGYRRNFKESFDEAKFQYGIITSLPFKPEKADKNDEDKLKFYLKNEDNRFKYENEIYRLMKKNKSLEILYHQQMGKIYARTETRRLHEIGLEKGYFGILESMIIVSGETKKDIQKIANAIIPQSKRPFVYTFQLKEKKAKKQ